MTTRNPKARDARGSGSTLAGQRRNHQGQQTPRDVDERTLEVKNGKTRIKALDGIVRPATGASLADLTTCVQRMVDLLQGRR